MCLLHYIDGLPKLPSTRILRNVKKRVPFDELQPFLFLILSHKAVLGKLLPLIARKTFL